MHCNKATSFITVGCLLLAVILGATAVATNNWLKLSAGDAQTPDITIGPLKTCQDGGACVNSGDTADQAACPNRTGDGYATRMFASLGLAGAGVVCALLAIIFAACCSTAQGRSTCLPAQLVLTFLALCCTGASAAVFHLSLQNWWFCGVSYCEWLKTFRTARAGEEVELETCSSSFGYSFYLIMLAAVFLWIAMVLIIFKMCCCRGPSYANEKYEEEEHYPPTRSQSHRVSHTPARSTSVNAPYDAEVAHVMQARALPRVAPPVIKAGAQPEEYIWDEESQLYWGEKDQLYWDLESGEFYCAEGGQWYNAATDTWYTKEE